MVRRLAAQWLLGVILAIAPSEFRARTDVERPAIVLSVGAPMPDLAGHRLRRVAGLA